MKKYILLTIAWTATAFALFWAANAFAAVSYERAPAGIDITSPVTFSITLDDYGDIGPTCTSTANYWTIDASTYDYADTFYLLDVVASTTLLNDFVFDLPEGDYIEVELGCLFAVPTTQEQAASYWVDGQAIEDNGGEIIFTITSAALLEAMFTVPTSTATDVLANVTSTLGDTGFLALLAIAAAIPLVFYVARGIISLVAGRGRGRR